jgi:RNA polymerase sigma factor (sigma-70 family)
MTPLLAQRSRQDRQFERIYRKHVGDVYRYALAVLRNPDDAEDVTQTTFMNAYRAFQRGDRPETPKNWLIAIAHNVCRQRFRQASRRPNEVEFVEDVAPAPEEVEEKYSVEDIQRALGQLAFNQRSALVMRELEGRSYAEIAGILGVTVGAVETLIFRARRALREQLEGSLSCEDAELALSRQADGVLPRADKGALRAHLRECATCATAARRMRAQRGALKALGAAPIPGPLIGWVSSLFGGSAAATGSAFAVKAAAVTAAGLLVAGGGVEGKRLVEKHHVATAPPAARASAKPRPSTVAQAVSASSLVRLAPTVARPASAKTNGRSAEARAEQTSAVAKKGLGPRAGATKVAGGVGHAPDTRGQTRSELAHATAAARAQARVLTKPARTSPAHTATAVGKPAGTSPAHTAKAGGKTTPPTPKATPKSTTATKTTTAKTPPRKHKTTRRPLRDEPVRPVTTPKPPRPEASGDGRVNPHG